MSATDKIQNATEEAKGTVKKGVGKVTDDHSLEAEGQAHKSKANAKQAGEKVKDALK